MEIFNLFQSRNVPLLAFKQNDGAGISTLKFISDRLAPSIFCPKMESKRPMREETMEK